MLTSRIFLQTGLDSPNHVDLSQENNFYAQPLSGQRDVLRNHRRDGMYIPIGYTWETSAMTSSTVFTTNRSQAVRLPKAVAFPEGVHEVDILKIGRSRVIVPKGRGWDDLFQSAQKVSEDFMPQREQPPAEDREPL